MPAFESPEYLDLYNSGFHAAATLQNDLFEQLRQAGVVSMITNKTTRKFFKPPLPLTKEELERGSIWDNVPTREVLDEVFDHSGWRVSVLRPEMANSGRWGDLLKIEAIWTEREFYSGRLHPVRTNKVLFSYSPRHNLFINGAQRVFNGKLIIPPTDSQTEKLKTAVNQAFRKPKTEQVRSGRRIMGPVIRLGATA